MGIASAQSSDFEASFSLLSCLTHIDLEGLTAVGYYSNLRRTVCLPMGYD